MTSAVKKETRKSGQGQGAKAFFAKMSRGLMLPIALLPIAGLFLGVGAGFENVIKTAMGDGASDEAIAQATFFFVVMKSIGDVIFANLPTLFCLGIAVAYAHDSGVATLSALIGWIIFNATQSTMIWDHNTFQAFTFNEQTFSENFTIISGLLSANSSWIIDWMNNFPGEVFDENGMVTGNALEAMNTSLYNFIYGGAEFFYNNGDSSIIFSSVSNDLSKELIKLFGATSATSDGSFDILWWTGVPASVVGMNVGLQSMQTSVFGGITIGLFVAYLYNKFHDFQMPKVLGFFSGNKFVPIITFLTVPLWGFFFLMVWPAFGIGLDAFGGMLGQMPAGIDSFIFGVVERALVPFGLHHVFYAPLWYTSAGGLLLDSSGNLLAAGNQNIWFEFQSLGIDFSALPGIGQVSDTWGVYEFINGDWVYVSGHAGMEASINGDGTTTDITTYWAITNGNEFYFMTPGTNPGSYMQGKFVIMIFGLPAAAAAMIMACKKENRQVAISVIGAAGLTSFLTGITEPLEFTFLFLAPYLYYGFHIWMAGFAFMITDVLGAHVALTFSGGIFDFVLFGILPDSTGFGVNSFWILALGIIYIPIYYFVFYFAIIKLDIKTPGRTDDLTINMISKSEFNKAKEDKKLEKNKKNKKNKKIKKNQPKNQKNVKQKSGKQANGEYIIAEDRVDRVNLLIKNLGGHDNFNTADACITRLRITVIDRDKVDDDALRLMGAAGVVGKGTAIQIIFGWEADLFKNEINGKFGIK